MMILPFTGHRLSRRSLIWGGLAVAGMTLFYAMVLILAAGVEHLVDQALADWYWLALIIPGFGLQVTLLTELRRHHAGSMAMTGVGSASSAAGMLACCAHHLAELLPIFGMAGVAGFLTDWKPWFLAAGAGITYVMVVRSWRHLAGMGSLEAEACVAVS